MAKIKTNAKEDLKEVVAPLPDMDAEETATPSAETESPKEEAPLGETPAAEEKATEPEVKAEEPAPAAPAEPVDDSPIAITETTVTENQLKALKKKYKRIFVTDYIDTRYVWHRLNRRTFSDICDATEKIEDEDALIAERERRFCAACIVYPDADKVKADVEDDVMASKLAREILYRSGFFPPTTSEV